MPQMVASSKGPLLLARCCCAAGVTAFLQKVKPRRTRNKLWRTLQQLHSTCDRCRRRCCLLHDQLRLTAALL